MQYAVFVYVSSAQAVIQDLFDRERSDNRQSKAAERTKQALSEAKTLLWGKEKSKRTKNSCKNGFFTFFLQKICLCQKKAVSLHSKSVNHFPLWVNNQKTLYYVSTIQV